MTDTPSKPMTCRGLIALLGEQDPDLPVYVRGYEDGIDDIKGVATVRVVRDANSEWYYGTHHRINPDHPDPIAGETAGLYLSV